MCIPKFLAPLGYHCATLFKRRIRKQRKAPMARPVSQDQLVIIPIQGLHSHRCEQTIQHALMREAGVNEVEVDFLSGQCSILFDAGQVPISQLVEIIRNVGYTPNGYSKSSASEE